ncbi:MAG: hypothetical protein E7270_08320 [Lachnospiraceae bacterium]|nr:hypothetical protein [Lachnospiraceae bacterium]
MKKLCIIIVAICIIIISGVAFRRYKNRTNFVDEKDTYDLNIDVLNESYPTDIILCGENIPFREALVVRKVDKITEEALKTDKAHQIIILSDLDGTLKITDEELKLIKNKLDKFECNFYYVGTNLKDRLINLEFIESWPEDDYCVALFNNDNTIYSFYGIWKESDKQATGDNRESLGHVLVSGFVNNLKESYQ